MSQHHGEPPFHVVSKPARDDKGAKIFRLGAIAKKQGGLWTISPGPQRTNKHLLPGKPHRGPSANLPWNRRTPRDISHTPQKIISRASTARTDFSSGVNGKGRFFFGRQRQGPLQRRRHDFTFSVRFFLSLRRHREYHLNLMRT